MLNVALCGGIGHGKDTVAGYLVARYRYVAISIAEPLKRVAMEIFGLERRHVFGTQQDKLEELAHVRDAAGLPQTPRRILEWLGTEGFRTLDPDVWMKLAQRRAQEANAHGIPVVFSDTRFANEFDMARGLNAAVWHVLKIGGEQLRTGHQSDEEWRTIRKDATIAAHAGDIAGLQASVDQILAGGGLDRFI